MSQGIREEEEDEDGEYEWFEEEDWSDLSSSSSDDEEEMRALLAKYAKEQPDDKPEPGKLPHQLILQPEELNPGMRYKNRPGPDLDDPYHFAGAARMHKEIVPIAMTLCTIRSLIDNYFTLTLEQHLYRDELDQYLANPMLNRKDLIGYMDSNVTHLHDSMGFTTFIILYGTIYTLLDFLWWFALVYATYLCTMGLVLKLHAERRILARLHMMEDTGDVMVVQNAEMMDKPKKLVKRRIKKPGEENEATQGGGKGGDKDGAGGGISYIQDDEDSEMEFVTMSGPSKPPEPMDDERLPPTKTLGDVMKTPPGQKPSPHMKGMAAKPAGGLKMSPSMQLMQDRLEGKGMGAEEQKKIKDAMNLAATASLKDDQDEQKDGDPAAENSKIKVNDVNSPKETDADQKADNSGVQPKAAAESKLTDNPVHSDKPEGEEKPEAGEDVPSVPAESNVPTAGKTPAEKQESGNTFGKVPDEQTAEERRQIEAAENKIPDEKPASGLPGQVPDPVPDPATGSKSASKERGTTGSQSASKERATGSKAASKERRPTGSKANSKERKEGSKVGPKLGSKTGSKEKPSSLIDQDSEGSFEVFELSQPKQISRPGSEASSNKAARKSKTRKGSGREFQFMTNVVATYTTPVKDTDGPSKPNFGAGIGSAALGSVSTHKSARSRKHSDFIGAKSSVMTTGNPEIYESPESAEKLIAGAEVKNTFKERVLGWLGVGKYASSVEKAKSIMKMGELRKKQAAFYGGALPEYLPGEVSLKEISLGAFILSLLNRCLLIMVRLSKFPPAVMAGVLFLFLGTANITSIIMVARRVIPPGGEYVDSWLVCQRTFQSVNGVFLCSVIGVFLIGRFYLQFYNDMHQSLLNIRIPDFFAQMVLLGILTQLLVPCAMKFAFMFFCGHFTAASNGFVKGVGRKNRVHAFHEPVTVSLLLFSFFARSFLTRILLMRVHGMIFVGMMFKDVAYVILHYIIKFDHKYQILMSRWHANMNEDAADSQMKIQRLMGSNFNPHNVDVDYVFETPGSSKALAESHGKTRKSPTNLAASYRVSESEPIRESMFIKSDLGQSIPGSPSGGNAHNRDSTNSEVNLPGQMGLSNRHSGTGNLQKVPSATNKVLKMFKPKQESYVNAQMEKSIRKKQEELANMDLKFMQQKELHEHMQNVNDRVNEMIRVNKECMSAAMDKRKKVYRCNICLRFYLYAKAMYDFYVIPDNMIRRMLIWVEALEHLFVRNFRAILLQYPTELRYPWPPPPELNRRKNSLVEVDHTAEKAERVTYRHCNLAPGTNVQRTAYLSFGSEIIKIYNIPRFAGSDTRGNADLTGYQLYIMELQGLINNDKDNPKKGTFSTKKAMKKLSEPYMIKSFRNDKVRKSVTLHRGVRVRELPLVCPGMFSEMLRNNNNYLRVEELQLEADNIEIYGRNPQNQQMLDQTHVQTGKKGKKAPVPPQNSSSLQSVSKLGLLASEMGMMLKHSLHVEGSEDISVNLLDYEDDLSLFGYVLQEECAQFSCINAILQYHVHRQFVCRSAGKLVASIFFILTQTLFLVKRSTFYNEYSKAEFRWYNLTIGLMMLVADILEIIFVFRMHAKTRFRVFIDSAFLEVMRPGTIVLFCAIIYFAVPTMEAMVAAMYEVLYADELSKVSIPLIGDDEQGR